MTNPYDNQNPQPEYGQYGQPGQPGQYGQGPYTQPSYPQQANQPGPAVKGFLARLFDLSFDHYVTTSIVKIIFVILVVLQGIWALLFLAFAFDLNPGFGIISLVVAPIAWFLAVLLTRVGLESLVVVFKIKEDLGAIRNRGGF
ncbi:DUF4282 domain-containing protein [Streptosporangium sp. NBC_01756]|uniref:DUF4282 domain-containing protein n=1 Tax=Streptosporangium sp. NBC_01756 TaxID=2975950 RepID=UPI002DD9A304|nr:DUF4282 domain-containing protein [Streptosporangium sp. NBC_01756]WSC87937.1 DUF4282 domain-containing protein [Streptosporangium sp. NBC_01756]